MACGAIRRFEFAYFFLPSGTLADRCTRAKPLKNSGFW